MSKRHTCKKCKGDLYAIDKPFFGYHKKCFLELHPFERIQSTFKLTQTEVANKIGIKQSHFSKIINGSKQPSTEVLEKFCSVFGLDMKDYFDNKSIIDEDLFDHVKHSRWITLFDDFPLAVTDPQGEIIYVNRQFTKITGFTLEEVKGKNIIKYISKIGVNFLNAHYAADRKGLGDDFPFGISLKTKDKREVAVINLSRAVYNTKNEYIAKILIMMEATDFSLNELKKFIEQKLKGNLVYLIDPDVDLDKF